MKHKDLFILIILVFVISTQIVSQNYYLLKISIKNVLNNNPIENASIKIQGENTGGISSEYGYCELVVNNIPINIEVSHIAYRRIIVTLNASQIHDTIDILLKPLSVNLDEVNISAKRHGVFIQPDYSIIDFDFLDGQLLVLERSAAKLKETRLILMNTFFDTITTFYLFEKKKPIAIYKGCLGQCYLLTEDSAYQIVFADTTLSLNNSMELSVFHDIMDDCLFLIDSLVFFKKKDTKGYSYMYYTVNTKNKEVNTFIKSNDYERLHSLQESIVFLKKHPPSCSIFVAIDFEKRFMYKPFKQYLKLINNSIYYFNHQNSTIDIYSKECDFIQNFKINYHQSIGWSSKILVDRIMGKAYTIVKNNLLEINLLNGEILNSVNIGLHKKLLLHNGYAYILRKDYKMNQLETFISKVKL